MIPQDQQRDLDAMEEWSRGEVEASQTQHQVDSQFDDSVRACCVRTCCCCFPDLTMVSKRSLMFLPLHRPLVIV